MHPGRAPPPSRRDDLVSSALEQGARQLLAGKGEPSSAELANRAASAWERLTSHLSRLLGATGVTLLVRRSVSIASTPHPWLATALKAEHLLDGLREVMAMQAPELIASAFVSVLSAFVGLLQRLIGEELVERLLEEVWPSVFTEGAKDTA